MGTDDSKVRIAATAAVSGLLAGGLMSLFMMLNSFFHHQSVWRNANLIAALWFPESVAEQGYGNPALIGMTTHMVTSTVMGVIGISFIHGLGTRQMYLVGFAYAVASYPVVLAFVMMWADPIFVRETEILPMVIGHGIFGISYVAVLRALDRRSRGR